MKKILTLLATASLLTGLAVQAQPVYSNVVGMVKLTLERGKTSIVHNPFDDGNTSGTVEDVFGDLLPNGTSVYFWKTTQDGYDIATYGRGAWDNGDIVLVRGKAMFVSIPDSAAEASYDIVVSGSVPDGLDALTTSVQLVPGFTLTAFPYPMPVKVVDANIPAQNGDTIFFWDGSSWEIVTYGRGAWDSDTAEFEPGKGFYYRSADLSPKNWSAQRPYNLD
jgi:hypothetical protein